MRFCLLPLFPLLMSMPACQTNRQAAVATTPATAPTTAGTGTEAPQQQQKPVLTFGRTACFGTCPDYTARFFADGRVEYEGRKYAPVEGNRTVKIDPVVVQQLLREADQIGFFQLRDVYTKGAMDLPSTILSITTAKGTKNVRVDEGGPDNLQKLFAHLHLEVEKALGVVADK